MKRNYKILSIILALLFISVTFAACGDTPEPTPEPPPAIAELVPDTTAEMEIAEPTPERVNIWDFAGRNLDEVKDQFGQLIEENEFSYHVEHPYVEHTFEDGVRITTINNIISMFSVDFRLAHPEAFHYDIIDGTSTRADVMERFGSPIYVVTEPIDWLEELGVAVIYTYYNDSDTRIDFWFSEAEQVMHISFGPFFGTEPTQESLPELTVSDDIRNLLGMSHHDIFGGESHTAAGWLQATVYTAVPWEQDMLVGSCCCTRTSNLSIGTVFAPINRVFSGIDSLYLADLQEKFGDDFSIGRTDTYAGLIDSVHFEPGWEHATGLYRGSVQIDGLSFRFYWNPGDTYVTHVWVDSL